MTASSIDQVVRAALARLEIPATAVDPGQVAAALRRLLDGLERFADIGTAATGGDRE